jgi:transcriptional regulator with XRE-family HTH domain
MCDRMFGRLIKEARIKKGMNQQQLAEALGCTQAAVSQFEGGTREPGPSIRRRIKEALLEPRGYVEELLVVAEELQDEYLEILLEMAKVLKAKEDSAEHFSKQKLDADALAQGRKNR